ncbi:APC family permease [Mycobacterium lacus]|uniref:Putative transporter n=2 Tax=Mycobacterium lacus TaxID=169765 RepID=A0A1X1Y7C6_9MYCO|nr:APC family permease [Mycobacterium lacus]MCV7124270.1 APC family permease [Mycobacterium lacus]ORW06934.1 transporter [Mycobacterium lacus]BBX96666.1 putative transporter [Mycobacterium lacus]
MLGINSIIGAGIFLTPGAVIKLAGPLAPLAYILAGLFAGVMALVFASAARYVRTNGASYAYTTAAFGQRVGIYVGVTHAITASIAWGVLASLFVSTLLRVAFPGKAWADNDQLLSVKTLTFVALIGVLLTINLFGNRVIRWANGTSTLGKVFALSVFTAGGLWVIATCRVNNYGTSSSAYHPASYSLLGVAEIGTSTASSLALATIAALYAFTGFESIANAAEEMDTPDRTLPRAIPLAIFAVGMIYLLAVVVAMLLGSDKIVASHDTVKLAAAIGNDAFRTVVIVGALVSMFGINVAASFGAPRLWTALADRRILPTGLSRKNRFGVPMIAFGITASLALAFPLALRFDNMNLTGLAVIARFVQFIIVPIALIALARSQAEEHAGIRRNAFTDKALPIVAVVVSVGLAVSFDYRSIFLTRAGPNYFSIALVASTFIAVPTLAYLHYYRTLGRVGAGPGLGE